MAILWVISLPPIPFTGCVDNISSMIQTFMTKIECFTLHPRHPDASFPSCKTCFLSGVPYCMVSSWTSFTPQSFLPDCRQSIAMFCEICLLLILQFELSAIPSSLTPTNPLPLTPCLVALPCAQFPSQWNQDQVLTARLGLLSVLSPGHS
jgi:hypothetical protein